MPTIDFEPLGRRTLAAPHETLLQAAQKAGIELVSVCGGMGTCEDCRVQVLSGPCSPLTTIEEVVFTPTEQAAGFRLACQCQPLGALKVHLPPESLTTPQRLQVEGLELAPEPPSLFAFYELSLPEPTLEDLRSDQTRLLEALPPGLTLRPPLLTTLSDQLRAQAWQARAVAQGGQVVAVLPPGAPAYGLAVDVGTTKLAAYLVALDSGQSVARASAMNPQIGFGEDVVSRIFYCMEHPEGRRLMQERLIATLNGLLDSLRGEVGAPPESVVAAAVVGNTAMHHLFAGLPVQQLGLMPFVPAVSAALELPAGALGLRLGPGASVYLAPNLAGYVGADHIAMLLGSGALEGTGITLAVDIGTNTEISLLDGERIVSCSCASGPAFEGAHLQDGMRAASGAIERVRIQAGQAQVQTIGGVPATGICGSGILDGVAELYRAGIVDDRGIFSPAAPGLQGEGKNRGFVLVPALHSGTGRNLMLTRRDLQEVLLAKAAIRTGIEILLQVAGLEAAQVTRFIVAGAFGTYLDLESAVQIGMFPDLPRPRFQQVGNAAGAGARRLLTSTPARQTAADLAARMHYVELTAHPRFKDVFMDSMRLG